MTSRRSKDGDIEAGRGPRLDGYLSRAGLASRKQARALIRQGRVSVDGAVCRDASRRIEDEIVALDGARVDSPVERADYLMHKPVGVACSHDEREAPLVFDLLDDTLRHRKLKIAGRLDRETSGLLVLTTDGDFIHCMTHPTRKVAKRYRVTYRGTLPEDAAQRCREGMLLTGDETPTRPAELSVEGADRATLVLREGRTHQVRRMFRAMGTIVTALHRDRVASLDLPADLDPGDLRPLEPEERALLLSDSSL